MSSIPKINSIGKVNFAKFQSNADTTNSMISMKDYEYDSFTPSFQGGKTKPLVKKVGQAARNNGQSKAANLKKGLMALLGGTLVVSQLPVQTGCKPEPLPEPPSHNFYNFNYNENNVTLSTAEITAYLQDIVNQLIAANDALNTNNAQNAAFFAQVIGILADGHVGIDTIIDYLEQNEQHLSNLVQGNEDLKAILLRIEALHIDNNNMTAEQNQLLSQLLAAVLNIDAHQNANAEDIIALINQLLDQVANMNEQQAQNAAAIIQAINHMSEQLQEKLLDILEFIKTLPDTMQNGYNAILAQLVHMENGLQEALINLFNDLFNHLDQLGDDIKAKLDALIALAGQMNSTMLGCTANILAQLQQMQHDQQEQALNILAAMQNMGTMLQQNYANIVNLINGLADEFKTMLLGILNQMIHMEDQQEQQYINILAALTDTTATDEIKELLIQILAKLDGIGEAQAQYYLSVLEALMQNNQLNAQIKELVLQLIGEIQEWHDDDEQHYLSIIGAITQNGQINEEVCALLQEVINNMHSMQEADEQHYLSLLNALLCNNQLTAQNKALLLRILNKMQHMEDQQEQQYLSILEVLQQQGATGEDLAPILYQILAKMQDMQSADEQHYLNIMTQLQNMAQEAHADFLAFMNKLTNLENGQQQILNAMQSLNAQFLAKFTQALAKLDTIIGNQATQIAQLANIYTSIQEGNATLESLDEYIRSLVIDPISPVINVNLDVIEGLLAEILASQNTSNNLVATGNQMITFVLNTMNVIKGYMESVVDNQGIMIDWQEAIWNKIPTAIENNCNCSECCAQVIEILIEISELIENLDWNHEGIDDDLNGLLGKLMSTISNALTEMAGNNDQATVEKLCKEAKQLMAKISQASSNNNTNSVRYR